MACQCHQCREARESGATEPKMETVLTVEKLKAALERVASRIEGFATKEHEYDIATAIRGIAKELES